MDNLRSLGRRFRNAFSCCKDSRKEKEAAKQVILDSERAEAERLYRLMESCFEYAENIQDNLQVTTDNPVVLGNAKFWLKAQVERIKASWRPLKDQSLPDIFWLANAYSPYILESLAEPSLDAVKYWMTLVNYTNRKFVQFRHLRSPVRPKRNIFKRCSSFFFGK